jgi:hypothetical protein
MTTFGKWQWLVVSVLVGVLAVGVQTASGDDNTGGDVPAGMLTFMAGDVAECPPGWRVAQESSGRLVVGVTSSDAVGKLVGTALTSQEDRTHVHPFQTVAELPYKSISAANGGNGQGAAAARYTDSGVSEPASSGLPFVQLMGCVKK